MNTPEYKKIKSELCIEFKENRHNNYLKNYSKNRDNIRKTQRERINRRKVNDPEFRKKLNEYHRQYYLKNTPKILEYHKQYYLKNHEKLKEYSRIKTKEWYHKNPDRAKAISRRYAPKQAVTSKAWYTLNKELICKHRRELYLIKKKVIK